MQVLQRQLGVFSTFKYLQVRNVSYKTLVFHSPCPTWIYIHLCSCLHCMSLLSENIPTYSFIWFYLSLYMVYFKVLWVYIFLSIFPPTKSNYSSPFWLPPTLSVTCISLINYRCRFLTNLSNPCSPPSNLFLIIKMQSTF